MRICHIITRMIVGGAQENTFLSARGACEKGHKVVLLTGPSPGREGELLSRIDNPGVEVVETPLLVREISPLTDLRAIFFIRDYLKENKFDVVHTHTSKAGVIGRIAGKLAGVPLVTHTIHGLAYGPYESFLKNLVYKSSEFLAALCSDRIYAVAQAMIDQSLAAHIGKKEQYKVVYSGMELENFLHAKRDPGLRQELEIEEGVKVIGAVARLFPRKGYEELFPAFAKVLEEYPNTRLLILGDGPSRNDFEEMAKELGILDRIIFAGLVSPGIIHHYIAQMDMVVHLSLKEGLPRVAVQALAEGLPVVAYDLDGTPEVVREGFTGHLIAPQDKEGAIGAIKHLLSSPEECRKMGENGRELVKDIFPWQKMSDILLADYAESLAKKGIAPSE